MNKELIQNSKGQPLKEALLVFSIFNCRNIVCSFLPMCYGIVFCRTITCHLRDSVCLLYYTPFNNIQLASMFDL